jgi:hypothetical protein
MSQEGYETYSKPRPRTFPLQLDRLASTAPGSFEYASIYACANSAFPAIGGVDAAGSGGPGIRHIPGADGGDAGDFFYSVDWLGDTFIKFCI